MKHPAPFVCVVWYDAHTLQAGEYTLEEINDTFHKPALIQSYGLLVSDNEKGVTIAQEWTNPEDSNPTFRTLGFIPRQMVKEVVPLLTVKKSAKTSNKKSKGHAQSKIDENAQGGEASNASPDTHNSHT